MATVTQTSARRVTSAARWKNQRAGYEGLPACLAAVGGTSEPSDFAL